MQFTGGWRGYQARVLDEMESHFGDRRLHVVAAPGAGKTVLGLEIIRRIGRPALVFLPPSRSGSNGFRDCAPSFITNLR
ncbi:DEAD/DEAH box helicase family protein [Sphingopyxis sp. R3-92]|uniref:DEAD/DEAH box helicase family protein n=1 Tax=Sphingopyxis sp. R3-92 TaxID=3158553 RepID=UPI003EE564BD